ncbi:TPA: hypothetical protein L4R50_000354 [Pseudomonas aeruginosa]|nr:hypothetical protein [Pseudomonas aeruginosa]
MNSAVEQSIANNAGRFIVSDSGCVYLELRVNPMTPGAEVPLEKVNADATPYLAVAAELPFMGIKEATELVPLGLRDDWRLSVQQERGYSVWTLYSQKLPSFCDTAESAIYLKGL